MKSMRTVIEMNTFLVIFSSICVGIVFAQLVPKEVCYGYHNILEAFRYESDYYFFVEGLKTFKLSCDWDSREELMNIRKFEWLSDSQWTNIDNLRLITTVNYPGKGKRVLRMDKAQVCTLLPMIRS